MGERIKDTQWVMMPRDKIDPIKHRVGWLDISEDTKEMTSVSLEEGKMPYIEAHIETTAQILLKNGEAKVHAEFVIYPDDNAKLKMVWVTSTSGEETIYYPEKADEIGEIFYSVPYEGAMQVQGAFFVNETNTDFDFIPRAPYDNGALLVRASNVSKDRLKDGTQLAAERAFELLDYGLKMIASKD
jgi:hypothetical protein